MNNEDYTKIKELKEKAASLGYYSLAASLKDSQKIFLDSVNYNLERAMSKEIQKALIQKSDLGDVVLLEINEKHKSYYQLRGFFYGAIDNIRLEKSSIPSLISALQELAKEK